MHGAACCCGLRRTRATNGQVRAREPTFSLSRATKGLVRARSQYSLSLERLRGESQHSLRHTGQKSGWSSAPHPLVPGWELESSPQVAGALAALFLLVDPTRREAPGPVSTRPSFGMRAVQEHKFTAPKLPTALVPCGWCIETPSRS